MDKFTEEIKAMLKAIAKEALEDSIAHSDALKKKTDAEIAEMEKRAAAHKEKGEEDMRQVKRNLKRGFQTTWQLHR